MEKVSSASNEGQAGRFSTTRWTVVLQARDRQAAGAREALEELCRAYWYPVYAYVRRSGRSAADSQDLTQGFFERFLEREYLRSVDPEKGRFRSFLLVALKRYLANEARRDRAAKRGGGMAILSLDAEGAEERFAAERSDNLSPDELYERRWALSLLDRAVARLRAECEARGAGGVFGHLKQFLTVTPDEIAIADVAAAAGMSEGAVRVAAHRLRKRYRTVLREEIADTLGGGQDIDEELRHLRRILSRSGA